MLSWFWIILLLVGLVWFWLSWKVEKVRRQLIHTETGERMPAFSILFTPYNLINRLVWKKQSVKDSWLESMDTFPDIFLRWFGLSPRIVVTTPEAIAQVLQHRHTDKDSAGSLNSYSKNVLGKSLVIATDTGGGLTLRRVMNPAFKQEKLNSIVPIFVQAAAELASIWDEKIRTEDGVVDVSTSMKNITFDIIGKAGFGYEFGSIRGSSPERNNFELMLNGLINPVEFVFGKIATLYKTAYRKKVEHSAELTEKLVSEVIRKRKEQHALHGTPESRDVLDHILEADTGSELSQEDLLHNVYLFFIAGHETSSGTLVSLIYYLAKHPEIQEKCRQEIDTILAGGPPTKENLPHLVYLDAVLKETLRLNIPFSGLTMRVAKENMVIDGYYVPKGMGIAVNLNRAHYSPKLWGENALDFLPERWIGPEATKNKLLSFSMGPRYCIGKKFAMLEIKVIAATMLQKFSWELTPGWTWKDHLYTIALQPNRNLTVKLTERA